MFNINVPRSDYCHSRHLGRKPIFSLDSKVGKIALAKPEKVKEEDPAADDVTTSESVTSKPEEPAEAAEEVPAKSKCYKTFYVRNLEMFLISCTVCP
jgi:hypothetical protein